MAKEEVEVKCPNCKAKMEKELEVGVVRWRCPKCGRAVQWSI